MSNDDFDACVDDDFDDWEEGDREPAGPDPKDESPWDPKVAAQRTPDPMEPHQAPIVQGFNTKMRYATPGTNDYALKKVYGVLQNPMFHIHTAACRGVVFEGYSRYVMFWWCHDDVLRDNWSKTRLMYQLAGKLMERFAYYRALRAEQGHQWTHIGDLSVKV